MVNVLELEEQTFEPSYLSSPLVEKSITFSKVLCMFALHSKHTRALNFEIFFSHTSSSLGEKNITFSGSVVLTINNISGAGMLTLPMVFLPASEALHLGFRI